MEEREQEELKAYMASRGKKVGEGEKLDAKAINKVSKQDSNRRGWGGQVVAQEVLVGLRGG